MRHSVLWVKLSPNSSNRKLEISKYKVDEILYLFIFLLIINCDVNLEMNVISCSSTDPIFELIDSVS